MYNRDGEVSLSTKQQEIIRSHVENLLETCNLNSEADRDPPMVWPSDYSRVWEAIALKPHLLVSYMSKHSFETVSGPVDAEQILVALPPGKLPGQPLTRAGDSIVGYEKCDGHTTVQFACDPRVANLFEVEIEHGICAHHSR